jgi:4-amino-4-deoxy-L-arabinose transferase-like glycosyltransferase
METKALDRTAQFFRYSLLTCALIYVVVYLILALFRIQYPFELEWMEGGSVDHVRRILRGQKLYVSPSLQFIPYIYTPFYFYCSAAVSKILGIGFIPLRLISFISSLGSFFIIFLIVKQETRNIFSGVLASCLFAATFQISGAWFDIARADSLFLFLLLLAVYIMRFYTSRQSYIIAGVCISLAFLTKQTALFISLPLMVYAIYRSRRCSIFFIGIIVVIVGISTILLNYLHEGWYSFYVFELPREHTTLQHILMQFWSKDLLSSLPIVCVMSLFYLFTQLLHAPKEEFLFYFLLAVGMIGGAWISRLHIGGYLNTLFPAYAVLSILFGLATHTVSELINAAFQEKKKLMEISFYLVCIVQFASLGYNPLRQIPTVKDLEAGKNLITAITQIKGEVFVPWHGYLSALAGKNSYAHRMAMIDILRGNDARAKIKLNNEIQQAIREKKFAAIILDIRRFEFDIEKYYKIKELVFTNKEVFWPVTGLRRRPEFIYVPKNGNAY